jgi:hypothetical protein
METVTLTKKEYSELLDVKRKLDKLLKVKEEKTPPKKDGFREAFGALKESFKGDSLSYVSKLRKAWRK